MTTFRNGDRVRVVNNNSIRRDLTGKTGTVEDAEDPREVVVWVDGEEYAMYFDPSELALATDPRDDALDQIAEYVRTVGDLPWSATTTGMKAAVEDIAAILRRTGREV